MKVVQLFPRPTTQTPDPAGAAADSNHGAQHPQAPQPAPAAPTRVEPPQRPPVQVIVRKRKQRVAKLSPAAVLARAANPGAGFGRLQADLLARVFEHKPAAAPVAIPSAPKPAREAPTADSQFWQIWLSHRDYLYRFSLRFSNGNAADAEDAMSEAMLKAAAAFHEDGIRNQRAWLLRLVHNACMDRHRGHQRQHRMVRDVAGDGDFLCPIVAPQHSRSPEELLTAFQLVSALEQALRELPDLLAEPLMLYLDERPDAEIASSLNVSKEVVRKRRQMARDWLRRRLMG